jgi:hypothetical protein
MKKVRIFRPARAGAKPSERWNNRPRMQRRQIDKWAAESAAYVNKLSREIQSLRKDSA